ALVDLCQPREALGADRRAGDVPAIIGSAAALVALAAPGADVAAGQLVGHPTGLTIGVELDPAAVGGEDQQPLVIRGVLNSLDELAGVLGLAVGHRIGGEGLAQGRREAGGVGPESLAA